jgi:hypothetical protein
VRLGERATGGAANEGVMRSAAALLFAAFLIAGTGWAAGADQPPAERELTVTNHAAQPINEVYVTPSSTDHWGDDRLGDQTLAAGQSLHLKLGRVRDCEFDLQVVYEDASREEAHGINVCRNRQVAFDGSGAKSLASLPAHDISIDNRSARPIQQVLISSTDAGDWGDDRLGNRSISVGDSATLHYRGDCVADLRVVFDNRSAEERRGIDICASRRIVVQPGWTTADTLPTEARPGNETVQLDVTNRTGRRITGLYLLPEGKAENGPELLGNGGLDDGGHVTIAFPRPAMTCRFAARVQFGGARAQEMTGLDLCRSLDVVLPPGA